MPGNFNFLFEQATGPSTPAPPIPTSPPVAGYIAWYDESSWTGSQWTDMSGNGNHVTSFSGVSTTTVAGNGSSGTVATLQGNTASYMSWPSNILPSTYTLFHVARYTGGTNERIITSDEYNWLSGHWNGNTAVAYHEGWVTTPFQNPYGNNWIYSTDQNFLYRGNGVTYGTDGGGYSSHLAINLDFYGEKSDWQVAEVIVYDTTLNSTDYLAVEAYLATKYGL